MLDGIGHRCAHTDHKEKRDGISSRCGCVFLNFDVNMICHEKMLCSCDSHGLNNRAHTYCMPIQNSFFSPFLFSPELGNSVRLSQDIYWASEWASWYGKKKWLGITFDDGDNAQARQWLRPLGIAATTTQRDTLHFEVRSFVQAPL